MSAAKERSVAFYWEECKTKVVARGVNPKKHRARRLKKKPATRVGLPATGHGRVLHAGALRLTSGALL